MLLTRYQCVYRTGMSYRTTEVSVRAAKTKSWYPIPTLYSIGECIAGAFNALDGIALSPFRTALFTHAIANVVSHRYRYHSVWSSAVFPSWSETALFNYILDVLVCVDEHPYRIG